MIFETHNSKNPIHTSSTLNNQTLHNLRDSALFALASLNHDNKCSVTTTKVLNQIISLQEKKLSSPYYGLWPWYYEEPIDKMPSPDFNTAAFISYFLITIYKNYQHLLSNELKNILKNSISAAVTFMIKRNTDPQNSHIVLMECYVCVLCGELFSRLEFVNYAMKKFDKFFHFCSFNGDFFYFNSIQYALIMASIFSDILKNVKNNNVLYAAKKLNKTLWDCIAKHYHYQTGQIAGPFSRSVSDFISINEKYILSQAIESNTLDVENIFFPMYITSTPYCPPQFRAFFTGEKQSKYSQRLISHGTNYPQITFPQVATTYMQPKYALGSFNRQYFWNEHRPLIAHFGSISNPYSAKIQCLIDHNNFTSSQLFCIQAENYILGHISLSTNHGMYHILDNKYAGKLSIKDFRIQYVIKGDTSNLRIKRSKKTITVIHDNINYIFAFGFYKIDNLKPYIEYTITDNVLSFDLVLYHGEKRTFNIAQLKCAIFQFSMLITESNDKTALSVNNKISNGYLISQQKHGEFNLLIKTPIKPNDWILQMLTPTQTINGTKLEDYARDSEESALQYDFIVNSSSSIPLYIESDSQIDTILSKIEELASLDFENIRIECKNIMNIIRSSQLSLNTAKRFSIQILTNIFDVAKNNDLLLENSIKYEYSNMYISLSQNNSFDAIEKTIMNTLDRIQINYKLFSKNKNKNDFINRITDIINKKYSDSSISLTYLAEKTGLSEQHISQKFHKITGITYLQYLTRVRMEHAKELISNGTTNSDIIANKIGYENATSFLRAFKKYTGVTITEFLNK